MKDIVKDIMLSIVSGCIGSTGIGAESLIISDDIVHLIDGIWEYFALVGIGMSIIYFLMEINRKLAFERSDFTLLSFSAPFLKFVASIIVITNGAQLIAWIVSAGNTFITWANDSFDPAWEAQEHLSACVDQMCESLGFFMALALILPAFVMFVVTIVCSLVWKFKALMYKIELLFRVGISPIALADVYSGQNAQAIRWLKALLGLGIYGASIIIVVKLGNAIATEEMATEIMEVMGVDPATGDVSEVDIGVWDMITAFAGMLVVPIAELGVISAIRSAIKEALA